MHERSKDLKLPCAQTAVKDCVNKMQAENEQTKELPRQLRFTSLSSMFICLAALTLGSFRYDALSWNFRLFSTRRISTWTTAIEAKTFCKVTIMSCDTTDDSKKLYSLSGILKNFWVDFTCQNPPKLWNFTLISWTFSELPTNECDNMKEGAVMERNQFVAGANSSRGASFRLFSNACDKMKIT